VGDRARGILDRYSIAAVQLAEHLYDMKDFRGAIEQVGPIVSWLQGELGTRARLVLSRSYLLDSSPEKAERPLKELLKADPRSIPAHLLLAVVYRSRGQLVLARDAYVQVLKLDPDNAHAEKELRDVRAQLGQPEAEAAALRAEAVTAHPGRTTAPPPHPRVSDAAPPEAEGSTSPSLGFIWWLLTLAVLSSRQVSGIDIDGRVLLTLMMVLLVGGAIVALWLWRRQATETTPTLGLGLGRETATPRPSDTVETRTHPAVVLASLLGAIGVLAVILVWAWRTPAQPSVPRAARLLDQGVAAFDAKDYAKAAGLLKRAADADPRLKDIFERLGRALHELGRSEDAISAFTRQVEVAPRHERAYAWRAYVLLADGRWADAEKDLLKQIEVAPSQAWSYEKLGERRMLERRFAEAVDFYARAAAIEPKLAQRWLDLGVAQAEAESPAEARRSLDKAMGLGPEDWMRVTAARTHLALGDLVKAGVLARSALQPLTRRLNRLRPELFGEADLYWVERLVEAWTLVGRAAAADGDAAEAERYLEAAWRVGFAPEAGNALSQLRKRQGRNREALELRHLAASVARWDPRQFGPPVLGASRPAPQPAAEAGLMELRTIELSGPSPADVTGRVLLLADADGRVETVSRLSRESEALDLQLASLAPIRLSWPRPDQEPFRIVKRGLLACSAESGCALVLDLPGEMSLPEVGKVRIVSQDPREGQLLIVGQRVAVSVTVQYELDSDEGMLELLVVDKASRSMVKLASQTVTASSGQTTLTGTLAVPDGAAGVGVLVSLRSRQASAIPVVAVAHFGVKTR
jgi:tetratricopeptide (TPR) repeat protein